MPSCRIAPFTARECAASAGIAAATRPGRPTFGWIWRSSREFQGLKYLQRKNQLLLTLAFFFLLLGPALLLLDKLSDFGARVVLNPTLDAVLSILLAGVFFLLYSIHQKTLLELIHTNGSIGLELKALPQKEERLLIRYLRAYLNSLEKQEPAPEEEAPEADDEEYDEDEEEEGEEPT